MEMHLVYAIKIRIWPNTQGKKNPKIRIILVATIKNRLGNLLRVNLHCIRIHHNITYTKAKRNTSQLPSRG